MSVVETKYLKVTFTREERAEFALELARKTQHINELELQKKEVASAIKAKIEEEVTMQVKLARLVNDGYDYRDVPIRWMMNFPSSGMKTAIREDTQEDCGTERMTEAERQEDLPFEDAPKKGGNK